MRIPTIEDLKDLSRETRAIINNLQLEGSEKQIAWAKKLLEQPIMRELEARFKRESSAPKPGLEQYQSDCYDKILLETSAAKIIDKYK